MKPIQYMLLVYENAPQWEALTDREKRRISDACWAWHQDLLRSRHARAAMGLHPPATAASIRRQNGELAVIDGPFAETKEVLGGFEIVECKDLDEAMAIAKTFPALSAGFALEVRPLVPQEELRPR